MPPEVLRELSGPITAALRGETLGPVDTLQFAGACANSTTKLLVRNSGGSPRLVVLVSPSEWPGVVAHSTEASRQARERLGDDLGNVILAPLFSGQVSGRSCMILPYCRPLSQVPLWRSLKNRFVRPPVLEWLRSATKKTMSEIPEPDLESAIAAPLRHLSSLDVLGEDLCRASRNGLEHLKSGAWRPQQVLMHGDLTRGNILESAPSPGTPGPRPSKFVIIDWAGSQLRGYPFFDLVNFGRSLGLRGRALKKEIDLHREILHCRPEEARYSLLAALGHLGMHPDQFPFEQFILLARVCFLELESALSAR